MLSRFYRLINTSRTNIYSKIRPPPQHIRDKYNRKNMATLGTPGRKHKITIVGSGNW